MKISPLSGSGIPTADYGAVSTTRSNPDRIAAAKAIAAGETPIRVMKSENNIDPQAERIQNVRKIKMKTNVSPDRIEEPVEETVDEVLAAEPSISDPNDAGTSEAEVTKPLSPQFAALAKQRRALQLKEREIADRERALTESTSKDGSVFSVDQLKSDPLGALDKAGVSYEQLTEAILNGQTNPEIAALKAEIKALKEGVDKNFVDRDTQAEQQVLSEMRREAAQLVAQGDQFEMVRETGSQPKVIDLIHRTYKKTGEVMDVQEALELVENQLVDDYSKIANLNKIKSKLTPEQSPEPQLQTGKRPMTTLSNRDNARPVLSRRERALAAFHGNKRQG